MATFVALDRDVLATAQQGAAGLRLVGGPWSGYTRNRADRS